MKNHTRIKRMDAGEMADFIYGITGGLCEVCPADDNVCKHMSYTPSEETDYFSDSTFCHMMLKKWLDKEAAQCEK